MKLKLFLGAIAFVVLTSTSFADEDYDHFPALAAPDVATALCNIKTYNEKLVAITNKDEMSAEDMVKVHELTYTLENALARLQTTLGDMAVVLEEVHKASERLDSGIINESGKTYLAGTSEFLKQSPCK